MPSAEIALVDDHRFGSERPALRTLREILENPAALEPPQAVVPRVVYEDRVTVYFGREKSGKSTFASAAAAAVSSGSPFLGRSLIVGDVLYVSLEEHSGEVARRLVSFDADPDRVHLLETLPDGLDTLKNATAIVGPRLVVVDSLVRLAAGFELDSGDAAGWDRPMEDLSWLARSFETGVLLIHHARKSDGEYRDSSAIGAAADALVKFSETDLAGERKFECRARWVMPNFKAILVGPEGRQRYELQDGNLSVEAQVLTHLRRSPGAPTRDVRRSVTAKAQEVTETLRELESRGLIEDRGTPTAREWHLVDGAVPKKPQAEPGRNRSGTASGTGSSENGAGGGSREASPRKGRPSEPPAPRTEWKTADDLPFD